jgi:CubicO group peptidase (beta-lactamase class C family)
MTGPEPCWAATVRNFTRETMAIHGIPAAALAVAEGGQERFAAGFGTREQGRSAPVTPDTIFGVASVTKGFTALAIMQLAEAGRLAIDDPVTRYLPAYRTPDAAGARATTLAHFLTHTAGLPPLPSRFFALARATAGDPYAAARPAWVADHAPLDSADDLLAFIAECDFAPLGPPGERFSYSNEGFALLGAIIERVGGLPYETYVRERILEPLGMSRSTFDRGALPPGAALATFHVSRDTPHGRRAVPAPQGNYTPLWYAAGGLNSTARDLLRYLELFRTGGRSGGVRLLSEAGIAAMVAPRTAGGVPGAFYGYGLGIVLHYGDTWLVQHGGGSKGISSHILVAPARDYTAVALTNVSDVPADQLALAPLNKILDRPLADRTVTYGEATYPLGFLARCVGTYRGGEGQEVIAGLKQDRLVVRLAGQTLAARPVGDDGFVVDTLSGESYLQFLLPDGVGAAWGVRSGSRIVPRAADVTE